MNHAHILQAALNHIPIGLQSLRDYEITAQDFVRSDIWQYIQQGSDQNISLAANRRAFDDYGLQPRILRDVHHGGVSVQILDETWQAPLALAPVAYHGLVHPEAELATVRAAVAMQTPLVVSTLSSCRFQDIRLAAETVAQELKRPVPPLWLQLYSQASQQQTQKVLQDALEAQFSAVMWTVDAHYKRSSLALPEGVSAVNIDVDAQYKHTSHLLDEQLVFGSWFTKHAPTWDDLAWLRQQTNLPLWLKGVSHPEDAKIALEYGINGLVVSNHGGRVLDGMAAPLHVLPEIKAATQGAVPILLDGGIRYGSDIVKALALGADAVMIGRPQMHALAVAGMLGVAHMLHLLRMELELALAQMGCARPQDLSFDCLVRLR